MKLTISVDGSTYEVDVEVTEPEPYQPTPWYANAPVQLPALAPPVSPGEKPVTAEASVCRSPVNGTVVRVVVAPGQTVEAADELLTLEAMKMETTITAPVAAVIAKINTEVGASVRAGAVLVEFE